jgi:excisionase family DNA binding protein
VTTHRPDGNHSLYRFFDADGRLLYVGITKTLAVRWRNHSEKHWWPSVATATITYFSNRVSAEVAETEAIITEKPLWNVKHSTTRKRICVPTAPAPLGGIAELTPAEVAAVLKVSTATVKRWEESGVLAPTRRLPGSGHRRYSKAAVEALKKRLAEEAAGQP